MVFGYMVFLALFRLYGQSDFSTKFFGFYPTSETAKWMRVRVYAAACECIRPRPHVVRTPSAFKRMAVLVRKSLIRLLAPSLSFSVIRKDRKRKKLRRS